MSSKFEESVYRILSCKPVTPNEIAKKLGISHKTALRAPLCEECGTTGLCSTCAELWESEIDLEDMEAGEE